MKIKKIASCLLVIALIFSSFQTHITKAASIDDPTLSNTIWSQLDGLSAGDWEGVNEGVTTYTKQVEDDNSYLQLNKTGQTSSSYLINHDITCGSKNVIELSVRMRIDKLQQTSYVLLTDKNNNVVFQFGFYGTYGNKVAYQKGSQVIPCIPYETDTWYTFRAVVNTKESKATLYVNDTEIASEVEIPRTSKVERLRIGVFSKSVATVDYDDFLLTGIESLTEPDSEPDHKSNILWEQKDGYSDGDWIGSNAGITTYEKMKEEDNYYLRLSKTEKTLSSYLLSHDFAQPQSEIMEVSLKTRVNVTGGTNYIIISDKKDNVIFQYGLYGTYQNRVAYQRGAAVYPVYPYKINTWHKISAFFNTQKKVVNLYCDDKLIASQIPYNDKFSIERIRIGIYSQSCENADYDEFYIAEHSLKDSLHYNIDPIVVGTTLGIVPELPQSIIVSDEWGNKLESTVSWEREVEAQDVAEEGSTVTITGMVDQIGQSINAVITVLKKNGIIYEGDFDSEDCINDWTSSNEQVENCIVSKDGNTYMEVPQTPAISKYKLEHMLTMPIPVTAERVTINAKLKVSACESRMFFQVVNQSGERIAQVGANSKGTFDVGGSSDGNSYGSYGIKKIENDKWYDVKFIFSPKLNRYHIYIDGKLAVSNMGFQSKGAISGVVFGASDLSKGSISLDSVAVSMSNERPEYDVAGIEIEAQQGENIELPEIVSINYKDGFVDTCKMTWDEYPSTYIPGVYSVSGKASSFFSSIYGIHNVVPVNASINIRESSQLSFYVDPQKGNDSNEGKSPNNAFKTIEKAQKTVRENVPFMNKDIYVYLSGGVYSLKDTLVFTERDSGKNGYYVHWTSLNEELPVISGGKKIDSWSQTKGKNYYEASIEDMQESSVFRQLYVNGERATRAGGKWFTGISYEYDKEGRRVGLNVSSKLIKDSYTNPDNLVLFHPQGFKADEFHINKIEYKNNGTATLYCYTPEDELFAWRSETHFKATDKWIILNAKEELNVPGEWYYDKVAKKYTTILIKIKI